MKTWELSHRIKVLEALGCLLGGRIELTSENSAKTYSSKGNKFYETNFDPKTNLIYTNDNMSFYVEKLGYPSIAFVALKGMIKYDKEIAGLLKDLVFKDVNKKFKNNWDNVEDYLIEYLEEKGIKKERTISEMNDIMSQLKALKLQKPDKLIPPPKTG